MDKVDVFKLIKIYCPACGYYTIGKGYDVSGENNEYLKVNISCEKCGDLSVVRSKK
jgi:RNase P subunit RPR2